MIEKSEIPLIILCFQAVGIIYSVTLFGSFGLNFADYADIDDFIFASFKEPFVFIVSLVSIIIYLRLSRKRFRIMALFIPAFIAFAFGLLSFFVVRYFQGVMPFSNTGMLVEVHFLPNTVETAPNDDNKFSSVYIIARAGDLFFFFDRFSESGRCVTSTIIVPQDKITRIAKVRDLLNDDNKIRTSCQI